MPSLERIPSLVALVVLAASCTSTNVTLPAVNTTQLHPPLPVFTDLPGRASTQAFLDAATATAWALAPAVTRTHIARVATVDSQIATDDAMHMATYGFPPNEIPLLTPTPEAGSLVLPLGWSRTEISYNPAIWTYTLSNEGRQTLTNNTIPGCFLYELGPHDLYFVELDPTLFGGISYGCTGPRPRSDGRTVLYCRATSGYRQPIAWVEGPVLILGSSTADFPSCLKLAKPIYSSLRGQDQYP